MGRAAACSTVTGSSLRVTAAQREGSSRISRRAELALLLLVALLPAASPRRPATTPCPATCASRIGRTYPSNPPNVQVYFSQISACRRACYINNYTYYAHSTKRQCFCYKTCTGTKQSPGSPAAVIGRTDACPDAVCPRDCATDVSRTYILEPAPTFLSQQPNVQQCQQTCQNLGTYYTYSTVSTCSCYPGCTKTKTDPTAVPTQMGLISPCFSPPAPKVYVCSVFQSQCPRTCVPKSSCVNSTGWDLKPRYQCCCKPGSKPVVVDGLLTKCI